MRRLLLAAALAGLTAAPALAQTRAPAPAAAQSAGPSTERGRDLAENGSQGGAAPCSSCHGMDGLANGNDQFPRLDGQSAYYLFKQLEDYASGARENEIMGPIAQSLSPAERQDLAAYYGGLRYHGTQAAAASADPPPTPPDAQTLQRGRRIADLGIAERGVQGCGNCHGPGGIGLAPATPRLAGQWASYARAQFEAFRSGTRRNDVAAVMRDLAKRLSDDEVAAVAAYLQTAQPAR